MFRRKQTRYYFFALLILIAVIIFPVITFKSYMSGGTLQIQWPVGVQRYSTQWPAQCFFLIALSQLLLLVTILSRKLKPQLIFAMIACTVYGVMLLTAIMTLYFDGSFVVTGGEPVPKPFSLNIWLAVAFAGWVLALLGNRELIKEIKLLDSQNRLR